MAGWLRIAVSVVLAVLFLHCGSARYTSPDGTFSIAMPGAVRSGIGSDRTSLGVVPYEQHYFQKRGTRYKVAFSVIQGAEGMGEGLLEEFGGKAGLQLAECASPSSRATVGGHLGLDYRTRCYNSNVVGRILLVGNRVYQITVESDTILEETAAKAFIESFRAKDQ